MSLFWKDKDKIQKNHSSTFNTEQMLQFSEVRGSCVLLKDWWLRSIVRAQGINLDLRSYDEQLQIIEWYKRFLNGLTFPIQIIVHNTYLDLTNYITSMKEKVVKLDNSILETYWNEYISFLDDINIKEWLIFVKEFYVIVPFYEWEADNDKIRRPWRQKFLDTLDSTWWAEKVIWRYRTFWKNKKLLDTRVSLISEWLKWIGVNCEALESQEIIQLLFKYYNPTVHWSQAKFWE